MNNLIHLRDAEFEEMVLKSNLPVVVEFWSPACGPCQMYVPVFEELATKYSDKLLIAKINVDENMVWANTYGVLGAPTILFMKNGEIVNRVNGYLSIDTLKKEIAKFVSNYSSKKYAHKNREGTSIKI